MIKSFVKVWDEHKDEVRSRLSEHPESYEVLVRSVVQMIADHTERYAKGPDPERIHLIDDGDYQGTLLFVIAGAGYQPRDYWYVKIDYGSCSGCDTLQGIRSYSYKAPLTKEQVNAYMTLALHIVQGLTPMQGEECGS